MQSYLYLCEHMWHSLENVVHALSDRESMLPVVVGNCSVVLAHCQAELQEFVSIKACGIHKIQEHGHCKLGLGHRVQWSTVKAKAEKLKQLMLSLIERLSCLSGGLKWRVQCIELTPKCQIIAKEELTH